MLKRPKRKGQLKKNENQMADNISYGLVSSEGIRSAYKTLTHQEAHKTLPNQHIQILWRIKAPLKGVIWLAIIWAIWLSRNDLIFNNVTPSPQQILDSAKVKLWLWIKGQNGMDSATMYSDWIAHPLVFALDKELFQLSWSFSSLED
ncbi:hypothetical protein Lal_00034069 [Lupinus albus]|nr:hypothetical protein Lal_00034069 [Lupinus albus]